MKHLNLYKSRQSIPTSVRGWFVRLEGVAIEKRSERRAFLQSIVGGLNRRGIDASVAPDDILNEFDIALLNLTKNQAESVISRYSNLGPEIIETKVSELGMLERAWQNRVRAELIQKGFMKIGDQYILEKDILDRSNKFKRSYRIQAVLADSFPSLFIDPRTRIMTALEEADINLADSLGEESKVYVSVLPKWQRGILIGKLGKRAIEMEYRLGNRMLKTPDYWRIKHNIGFVKSNEEMLEVYIPAFESTLSYPQSCVFKGFQRGMELPEELKKDPETRVEEGSEFLKNQLGSISFLGLSLAFEGPTPITQLGFCEHNFPAQDRFSLVVGNNIKTNVGGLHTALRQKGPYAGRLDGKYVVVHHSNENELREAFKSIERAYGTLNLGKLEPLSSIGHNGLIDAQGESVTDYTSTITEIRPRLGAENGKIIVFLVLPADFSSEVYYRSRGTLFERVFSFEPIPTQAISGETIGDILEGDKSSYPICVNTASQCYVKLGGTGSAVWILDDPADVPIPGISPSSSCYAYHDVSRRPTKKASATAYSAMTDTYGRYIATGTKPIGGERLTPATFYDILVELLQKISIFGQRYRKVDDMRSFNFQRLVFAKDGVLYDEEADMMEQVVHQGIPDERKEPIPDLLKKSIFPKSLIIDIMGVNKSPNKRVFNKYDTGFLNVSAGTAISYNETEGLLVSSSSRMGTSQPIEISLKKHLCLNRSDVVRPHISQIMDEYYRLTFLNWSSIFRQGKYALPQILTQNLGENISAGVLVPDDMILL